MKFSRTKAIEVTEKAIAMRKSGMKWKAIRNQLGISKTWLINHVASTGRVYKEITESKTSPELLKKTRELRSEGVRWKEIERQLGVNRLTLAKAIYTENKEMTHDGV